MTELPNSNGSTTICVIIDRFSKSCHLIPLKGLPTAMEMAKALFHQVFWVYGLGCKGHLYGSRIPVYVTGMENFLSQTQYKCKLNLWQDSQVERLNLEIGYYLWFYWSQKQHQWSTQNSLIHRGDPISLCSGLSATSVPVVWRTLGRGFHEL